MKKSIIMIIMILSVLLVGCTKSEVLELTSLLKSTISYEQAKTIVQASEKHEVQTVANKKLSSQMSTVDPVAAYFLGRYQSVNVQYKIVTDNDVIDATFEIRGEVFLNAIQNNVISITASMPQINFLFVSTQQLEELENENQEWKDSQEALLAPFTNKYRYGNTIDHFGFEIKDFSSTGGGMVTTETSNEFSYSATDNRLIKWQFQFFNKDETTSGTNVVYKTIEVTFDWILKD